MAARPVLVIEDEAQIRRVVRSIFTDDETRVVEAATGEEGIATAAAEPEALDCFKCRGTAGTAEAPIARRRQAAMRAG